MTDSSSLVDRLRLFAAKIEEQILRVEQTFPVCYLCNFFIMPGQKTHIDHIFPKSRGGSNDPSNLARVHARCNLQKGARTPEEWWDSPKYLWEYDRPEYRRRFGMFPIDLSE